MLLAKLPGNLIRVLLQLRLQPVDREKHFFLMLRRNCDYMDGKISPCSDESDKAKSSQAKLTAAL